MLKFAPLLLAVFLPLAAAPVAQGSVVDVEKILATDSLAGLDIVLGESAACPDRAGQAEELADQIDGDGVRRCPEGDEGPKALGGDAVAKAADRVAKARERVAQAGERNAAAAASVPDSSSSQGAVEDGPAGDAAVTGLAAQVDPGDDDPDLTVDEDNDLTVQDDDALDDEDVTVDEDNDITVEDDDESLPRTGLALGVPVLLGSLLLGGGLSLRRRIRRNDS